MKPSPIARLALAPLLPLLLARHPAHLCTPPLIALAHALFDELHQELTPGRSFELADIGYDLVGIIAALGLIWVREIKRTVFPISYETLLEITEGRVADVTED